jgi:hypothetical protein
MSARAIREDLTEGLVEALLGLGFDCAILSTPPDHALHIDGPTGGVPTADAATW